MRKIDGLMAPENTKTEKEEPKTEAPKRDFLAWDLPPRGSEERNFVWYAGVIFIIIAIIAYSAWQKDWFPIFIVPVVTVALFWHQKNNHEETVHFEINKLGVSVNERFVPYGEIHSFWITFVKERTILNIVLNKKYLPAIQLDITGQDAYMIKRVLGKRIPEQEKHTEGVLDMLIRVLKL